jgi:hypothetical protein
MVLVNLLLALNELCTHGTEALVGRPLAPFLVASFRVAAYFRYSIMWLESTMISGTKPEAIASIAHRCMRK